MKFRNFISIALLTLAISCQAQDYGFGVFPRVIPPLTYGSAFPVTGRDFVRNAFLPILSGADTIVYYCDAYGRFLKVRGADGGNGIYGGSGTVPSNVLSTVTNRIRFLGDDNFGNDHPFKIESSGNEPGILSLIANGDSLEFGRNDLEFRIDGGPGLSINSSRGNTDVSASGGFLSLGVLGSDSLKVYTNGSLAMTVDENQFVGIGTDNPQHRLHVTGTQLFGSTLIEEPGGQLVLRHKDATSYALVQNQFNITSMYGNTIGFFTANIERIKINGAEIGVATSTPTHGFDVATDVRFRNLLIEDYNEIASNGASVNLSTTITDNVYNAPTPPGFVTFTLPPAPSNGQISSISFISPVAAIGLSASSTILPSLPLVAITSNSKLTCKYIAGPPSQWFCNLAVQP